MRTLTHESSVDSEALASLEMLSIRKRSLFALVLLLTTMASITHPACAADIANGKRVFDVYCWGCHQPLPKGDNIVYGRLGGPTAVAGPRYVEPPNGTFTLLQRYHGKVPEALEERTNLTVALIKKVVRAGMATPKKPDQLGTIMPPIRKTEVSDQELDDIAAYLTRPR